MRMVGDFPHPKFKITLFSWNEKYLVKIEAGLFEQVYKIPFATCTSEEQLKALLTDDFLAEANTIFNSMALNLRSQYPQSNSH